MNMISRRTERKPLYGVEQLAEAPGDQVLLHGSVEDADAGTRLIPACLHLALDGDPREADLSPMKARSVVIAPMRETSPVAELSACLYSAGATTVKIIDAPQAGWTISGAAAGGIDANQIVATMKGRVRQVARPDSVAEPAALTSTDDAAVKPGETEPAEPAASPEAAATAASRAPAEEGGDSASHPRDRAETAARMFDPAPSDVETPTSGPRPVLDPENPRPSAREFLAAHHSHGKRVTMRFHSGLFYAWNGRCYPETDQAVLEAQLWEFLEHALRPAKGDLCEPFKPNRSKVGEVFAAVKSETVLHRDIQAPAWLNNDPDNPPAAEIMPCMNGLLHLPSKLLYDASPDLWCHNAVDFAYDPDAPAPAEWLKFLDQLWPDDPESVATLQEIFGYLLTADTSMQKIFMLIGPGRSGKGTIGRVLSALIGRGNIASPTLASICTNFGLQPLIGKSIALIGDARIGNRTDQAQITERLLSISGEDSIDIDRKFLPAWTGRLSSRIVILTNEIPKLADASGTLGSRFIILRLTRSFFGKEDPALTDRLVGELPGILNWAIEGWARLHDRRRFIQPKASADVVAQLQTLGSPVLAFVRECCEVEAGARIDTHELFSEWCRWCERQGKREHGTLAWFSRDLLAVVSGIEAKDDRAGASRKRRSVYLGIRIASHDETDAPPL